MFHNRIPAVTLCKGWMTALLLLIARSVPCLAQEPDSLARAAVPDSLVFPADSLVIRAAVDTTALPDSTVSSLSFDVIKVCPLYRRYPTAFRFISVREI